MLQQAATIATTPGDVQDEQRLLKRIRNGDRQAFDELTGPQLHRLKAFARKRLRKEDDIDDILQNALLKAFVRFDQFHGSSRFLTWVTSILENTIREHWRRTRARDLRPGLEQVIVQWSENASRCTDPGRNLDLARQVSMLRQCAGRLPDGVAEVVLMRDFEGLEPTVVAQKLKLTPSIVKVRLCRGRRRLAMLYRQEISRTRS